MKLLLATRNRKKLAELERILAEHTDVELLGLDDVPEYPEAPETALTFEGNAVAKARDGVRYTGLPCVADDSGIAVDALNGMPGVFSARWSGRHGDDQANVDLMLAQIGDVGDEHRGGAFVCAAALVFPDGTEHVVRGEARGRIIREPKGSNGFGYDPVFVPDGFDVTTAQMSAEQKDAISHRGKAFRLLAKLV
ncbi:MAG TPA: RdgB/HAM1 family non-canonical purine NTP pyrophosphatase [Stackebrandtia sp.]|uniref:RdgB/HAM1 family non-canonical purine NTP pyrophosphatase n=1 Tax=Stackebrandtia sp. TaxID=2023065 RepID=UPI002D6491BD|nr:RdgB/HAM1 family non-canonical purine NTP pyrophosphatase [Stackebrandtia sp.]HZE39673.1 RdgB/HAM1 family non-canonical purine NTP pyrophosphatase [Stackebrandtia sp.]